MKISLKKSEVIFLFFLYLAGLYLRLLPRLSLSPHLLTFEADIWYRLCLAQNLLDTGRLPVWDIRYLAYGHVPMWYNPLALYFFAFLSKIFSLDLPTISSRVMPFFESLVVLPMYFLCRALYSRRVAIIATVFLLLSPAFIFWTGISTPQTFTLFLLPIMILLWIRFLQERFLFANSWTHLFIMGLLLAIDFLMHLSFFTLAIILFFVHLALILESQAKARYFLYLFIPLAISQVLTFWWWLPKGLYWWWAQALTTSSAFYEGKLFLEHYGTLNAIFGHLAFIILIVFIVRRNKSFPAFYLVPILWAIFPIIESHNEGILKMIGHSQWCWINIAKPLEGFRFYCFLAQPLAVCFALAADRFFTHAPVPQKCGMVRGSAPGNPEEKGATVVKPWGSTLEHIKRLKFRKSICIFIVVVFSAALLVDMFKGYKLFERFRNPSMQIEEIQAAQWFRENSEAKDRILAEYFTAQMFGGICGGKALMGSPFPLKNVDIPYINQGWRVQQDIYSVYTTDDPKWIEVILKRYGCTDVFYSQKSLRHIEFITQGDTVLEDITGLEGKDFSATLFNPRYFRTIYENKDVKILEWIGS